ncbi:MAG: FkbM family methyltransferase [Alphaproteobacteria bacterium]|nr:FkbM family methyltransferase [Alphaproteobacteria bacterium]
MREDHRDIYTGAMNAAPPKSESHYDNTSTVQVDAKSGSYRFQFPDVANTGHHVRRILEGKDYPVLPIPGYEVETIVDVGANVGAFTVFMAAHFSAARCYCFEPSPGAVEYLRQNVAQFPNTEVFPIGLYSEDTSMPLFEGATQSLQNSLYNSAETSESNQSVELRHAGKMMSELKLGRISILKVDTEGAELPVLGALKSKLSDIDQIYLEYHSEDDRREIESLLADTHVLAAATAKHVHRGTNHYIRTSLLVEYPALDVLRVDRS